MVIQTKIGRYEVIATLGQGAMGTVYKAVDPLIERTVAIKTINLDLSNEERADFEERFYREAKSAGRLSHANIVTIYDVGEVDDIAYIAMEYLEGESLREMLDSGVVLPVERISKIAARIASALSYAHENQVVHRDIKPANIMITSNRDVKIMDFGIAQIPTGSRTQLGTVLGSPKYMAPEQVEGRPTDGKTDIFALGVVLYEMLTGNTPFNGDNLSAIMYKILNETPAPPSTLNPRVPPVFDRIVSRALSKRPEDRYQTAREFARDLRNHDVDSPLPMRPLVATIHQDSPDAVNRSAMKSDDATVFLSPQQARGLVPSAVSKTRFTERAATALRNVRSSRKLMLFGVPLMALAVVALYPSSAPDPAADFALPQDTPGQEEARAPVPPASVADPDEKRVPEVKPVAPPDRAEPIMSARTAPVVSPVPVVAQGSVTVSFAVSPWGEVFVDGERVGITPPLNKLQLEAGTHRVEIRNQGFAPYRETVRLKSGQSLKIRHKFR